MHKFFLIVAIVVLAAGCQLGDDIHPLRNPALSVKPVDGYIPEVGAQGVISYAEAASANPQGSYMFGTNLVSISSNEVDVKLVIKNESELPLLGVVINAYVEDPALFFIGKIAGQAFLGTPEGYKNPTPALLDENGNTVFESDPYTGRVGYFYATKNLGPGESFEFRVMAGAVPGFKMHLEAIAGIEGDEGYWAVPKPNSGTTIFVPQRN